MFAIYGAVAIARLNANNSNSPIRVLFFGKGLEGSQGANNKQSSESWPQIYADLCKSISTDLRKSVAKTCATKILVPYCAPPVPDTRTKVKFAGSLNQVLDAVLASPAADRIQFNTLSLPTVAVYMCVAFMNQPLLSIPLVFSPLRAAPQPPPTLLSNWRKRV